MRAAQVMGVRFGLSLEAAQLRITGLVHVPGFGLPHSQTQCAAHLPAPAAAVQYMRGATTASGLQALRPAFVADSPLLASFALKAAGPDREQVCMIYTFIVQAVAGFLLPAYFFLCHCSRCLGAGCAGPAARSACAAAQALLQAHGVVLFRQEGCWRPACAHCRRLPRLKAGSCRCRRSAVQHAERSGIPRENRLHRMYNGIHSVLCIHGNWVSRLSVLLVAMAGMWVVGCTLLPG